MLTSAQRAKYVSEEGKYCPHCGSKDIRTVGGLGGWRRTADHILEKVECWDCGEAWVDVYTHNVIVDAREIEMETE